MAAVSLRLPDSVYEFAKQLSQQDKVSLNQFIATAVAEKVSAMSTESYLKERAERGNRQKFIDALSNVPDTEPEENEKL